MTRESGARRIFLYNWPVYLATWVGAALAIGLAALLAPGLTWLAVLGAAGAIGWSAISLLVSFYIYDRSRLFEGHWVRAFLPTRMHDWCAIDAGLDAEVKLQLPGRCVARLDIFDPLYMSAGSIRRARGRTARAAPATAASPVELPLREASCDLIAVVFSAHELRDRPVRERFFAELKRALRPGGRLLLVEHLRDGPNFAAFGPGFLHFLPRTEWLRLMAGAGLTLAREERVTPWVAAFAMDKR